MNDKIYSFLDKADNYFICIISLIAVCLGAVKLYSLNIYSTEFYICFVLILIPLNFSIMYRRKIIMYRRKIDN